MSWNDTVALFYLRALPMTIRVRILNNPEFQNDVGINGLNAPFDDAGRIRLGDLLDTVREVYATGTARTIRNLDGDDIQIGLDEGRTTLVRVGDKTRGKTPRRFEFEVLSSNSQIRLGAFRAIPQQFGITGPISSHWMPVLEHRPLSNSEISQIHDAIIRSVPNWMSVIQDKISTRTLAQADLVPPLTEYFTTLCGPLPNNIGVDEYIRGPLTDHCQAFIAEDMLEGMSLLLPGCLRSDMSVVPLLSEFTDDDIWNAVVKLQGMSDPFTLLGLVEIALARRSTKQEFEVLAREIVEKLCGETLPRHDGLDVYEFFPALVKVSLHRLRRIDNMMTQPPYWHRLCAFTHAGLLTRWMDSVEFDPKGMTQWLESAVLIGDVLADILALRSEPTWHFNHLTRDRIQAEILGRLKVLEHRETAEGRQFPNSELLSRRIAGSTARGISPFRPGPLEGDLRPMRHKTERVLRDEDINVLISKLNDAPGEFPWAGVAEISVTAYLPDELRNSLTESLKTIELPGSTFLDRTNLLAVAGLIATVHKDQDMAEAIAERLFQESEKKFEGESETQQAFLTLLVASTAIDENEWIDWLKDKLYRLALIAPKGSSLKTLRIFIDELKTLLPISQWRFGQIEALCKLSGTRPDT